jgi:TP901 family phage tail tape measure protein
MSTEVKIKVSMDTAQATRNAAALAQASSRALVRVSADTKAAAIATREYSKTLQIQAEAGAATAKRSAAVAQALLAEEKATRSLNQAVLVETRSRQDAARAALSEAKIPETIARAKLAEINTRRLNQRAMTEEARQAKQAADTSARAERELTAVYQQQSRMRVSAEREADALIAQAHKEAVANSARAMREAAANSPSAVLGRRGSRLSAIGGGLSSVGGALTQNVTYPVIGAAAAAVAASVSRESSLTGITKLYPDASKQDVAKLNSDLVGLTHVLPVTYKDLASFGETGAQLGVPIKALGEFIKVTAQLGITTDATGEEAATGLAKIAAASGVAKESFGDFAKRAGSALSQMSSEGAASTSQIIDMTERFASAGKLAKMSVPDMLALSNAVAGMGQEAEAGGGAMQNLISKISIAVAGGGQKLGQFAAVAGMTGTSFKQLFQRDGFAAIMAFVEGLSNLDKHGRSSIDILTKMGVTDLRMRQSVLNLATGFQQAADLRKDANKAFQDGTVLDQRAGVVAQTSGSQFKIFWNQVEETGKAFGDELTPALIQILPTLKDMLKQAVDLVKTFAGMPRPLQEVVIASIALGTALGPVLSGVGGISTVAGAATRGLASLAGAETAAATSGAAAFAKGGPILVGLGLIAGAIWLIKQHWDDAKKAKEDYENFQHQNYANVKGPLQSAIDDRANALADAKASAASNQAEVARLRKAGPSAPEFTSNGEDAATARVEYEHALKQAKSNYSTAQNTIKKLTPLVATDNKPGPLTGSATVPAYVKTMLDNVGHVVGYQCGQAITNALKANGGKETVTSLLAQARKTPSMQVHADAKGNWPDGAILYFPPFRNRKGGMSPQHFASAYNGSMAAENTSEGAPRGPKGQRQWEYRADRKISDITAEHHGQVFGFMPPGVRVSTAAAGAGAPSLTGNAGGAPFDASLFDDPKGKAAKDKAQALVDAAGLNVDKAETALEHCKNEYARTKDPYFLILAKAALVKVRDARIEEATATLNKAQQEANQQGTNGEAAQAAFTAAKFKINTAFKNDTQALSDQFGGTPAEKQQRARDLHIAQQRNLLQGTQIAIDNYQRWMDRGDANQYDPLKSAFGKLRDRQIGMARLEYENQSASGKLADPGQERIRLQTLAAERDNTIKAATNAYAQSIIDLDEKHLNLQAQVFVREKDRLDLQRQMLDLDLQSAKSDDEKLSARQAIFENTKSQLLAQQEIDKRSTDPNTKAMAGTHFSLGIQSAQKELGQYGEDISDAARDRRIQFLRAEIEATDSLIAKGAMLVEVHKKEHEAAVDTGNPEAVNAANRQAARENSDNNRAVLYQSADDALTNRLMNGQGDPAAILDQYRSIINVGTLEQQREAIDRYLSTITTLIQVHAISRKQAVADLEAVKTDFGTLMTPDQAQQVKETTSQTKGMITVGGRAFWSEMIKSGADNSGGFLTALLTGKGAKNAMKGFLSSLASMAEQGFSGAVSGTITNAIMGGGLFGKHHKDGAVVPPASTSAITATTVATDSAAATADAAQNVITTAAGTVKQIPKATKESRIDMYQGAARIAAAAAALQVAMNPKKAKKASQWGLAGVVVGGILGSFSGDWAGGAQVGAGFGSLFGSAFAEGGKPPVNRISLAGERGPEPFVAATGRVSWLGVNGPELFMPKVPGVIIPNHMLPRAPSMAFVGSSPTSAAAGGTGTSSRYDSSGDVSGVQNFYGDIHRTVDLEQANRSFGKMLGTIRRNGGRGGGLK